jgi:hypothetical protein
MTNYEDFTMNSRGVSPIPMEDLHDLAYIRVGPGQTPNGGEFGITPFYDGVYSAPLSNIRVSSDQNPPAYSGLRDSSTEPPNPAFGTCMPKGGWTGVSGQGGIYSHAECLSSTIRPPRAAATDADIPVPFNGDPFQFNEIGEDLHERWATGLHPLFSDLSDHCRHCQMRGAMVRSRQDAYEAKSRAVNLPPVDPNDARARGARTARIEHEARLEHTRDQGVYAVMMETAHHGEHESVNMVWDPRATEFQRSTAWGILSRTGGLLSRMTWEYTNELERAEQAAAAMIFLLDDCVKNSMPRPGFGDIGRYFYTKVAPNSARCQQTGQRSLQVSTMQAARERWPTRDTDCGGITRMAHGQRLNQNVNTRMATHNASDPPQPVVEEDHQEPPVSDGPIPDEVADPTVLARMDAAAARKKANRSTTAAAKKLARADESKVALDAINEVMRQRKLESEADRHDARVKKARDLVASWTTGKFETKIYLAAKSLLATEDRVGAPDLPVSVKPEVIEEPIPLAPAYQDTHPNQDRTDIEALWGIGGHQSPPPAPVAGNWRKQRDGVFSFPKSRKRSRSE